MAASARVIATGTIGLTGSTAAVLALTGCNVAAGSGIVVIAQTDGPEPVATISDDVGHSYTYLGALWPGNPVYAPAMQASYVQNATAMSNGTITLRFNTATYSARVIAIELQGVVPTGLIDKWTGQLASYPGSNTISNFDSSAVELTSGARELLIGVVFGTEYMGSTNSSFSLTATPSSLGGGPWSLLNSLEAHGGPANTYYSGTLFTYTAATNSAVLAEFYGSLSANVSAIGTMVICCNVADVAPYAPTLIAHGSWQLNTVSRFAWTFSDPDAGDTQGSYQIVFTRASDGVTVYDSGQVSSANQYHDLSANALATGGIAYNWTVRCWDNHGTAGPYAGTLGVTPYNAPGAPTLAAHGDFNIAQATSFGWQFNDADAGVTQSSYQLQISHAGSGVLVYDSGQVSGANGAGNTATLPANTLPSGDTYHWTVRTWNSQGYVSPYAALGTFTAAGPATVAITSPAADGAVISGSDLTVRWSYSSQLPQGAYQVRLLLAGVQVYNSGELLGSATSLQLPALANSSSYQVGVTVWDTANTPSAEVLRSFTTNFPNTPQPFIIAAPAADGSGIGLTISAPAPVAGQTAAATFEVWRSDDGGSTWIRVATGLTPQ